MAIQYSTLGTDRSKSHKGVAQPRKSGGLLTPRVITDLVKVLDFGAVMLSGVFALKIFDGEASSVRHHTAALLLVAVLFIFCFERLGGYQFFRLSRLNSQIGTIMATWSIVGLLMFALEFSADVHSEEFILGWALTVFGLILINRVLLRWQINQWLRQGRLTRKLVVFGAGPPGEQFVTAVQAAKEKDVAVVAIFDDRSTRISPIIGGLEVAGTLNDLIAFVRGNPVDQVIVVLPLSAERRAKEIFDKLKSLPVDLRLSAANTELSIKGIGFTGQMPMLEILNRPIQNWNAVAKAAADGILAGALLLLFSVPMALIAMLIKIESRGPVLFVQDRYGYNNRVIGVLKFRTMNTSMGDPSGARRTVRNDPRVTRIGHLLRRFSLDELPQLINVMRGDLSMVGPRPHAVAMRVADRLFHETVAEYFERHKIKPGITGWAQVNGCRGEVDSEQIARQRVKYDIEYIENWSFWLDIRILFATIITVFRREKAY